MARIAHRRVEKAFRDAWRQSFAHDVKVSFWPAALIICALALLIGGLIAAQPRSLVGTVEGHIIGGHQPATDGIPPGMDVRVALDGGGEVNVSLPKGTLYLTNAKVELGVYDRRWPVGTRSYRFHRYLVPGQTRALIDPSP